MIPLLRAFGLFLALTLSTALAQTVPVLSNPTGAGGLGGTATLTVNVTTNGADTTVVFNYGLTNAYGATTNVVKTDASGAQTVTVPLSGLTPGSTYHFQVTASNSAGNATPTADQTFIVPPFATTVSAKPIGTTATLTGAVTANGTAGFAYFEFGLTSAYGALGSPTSSSSVPVDAINQTVNGTATGLTRNVTYHYRAVFMETGGITVFGDDETFLTNNAPIAQTDTINAATTGPTTILPLVNDRDPDGDALSVVDVATQPEHGTAVVSGNTIIYTPDGTSTGFDTFTYTIEDAFGLQATGTINIRSARAAFAGTHGGFIKRANGKEAGYFTITASPSGTFTGIAVIEGKRYVLSGTISADGTYRGWGTNGASAIPVLFLTEQTESGSQVTALFNGGQWASELNLSPSDKVERTQLLGRYTVGIAAGGSTAANGNDPGTPPEGSGWGALRISNDGTGSIKGKLADGRGYSSKGTVNYVDGSPVFTFYDDPEDTRVVGILTLGDTVTGTVQLDRHASGEGRFPRGYDMTQTADGARYVKPPDKRRVLDTETGTKGQDLEINFEGNGLPGSITRQLFLDDNDNVTVVDRGAEQLEMKIDRNSGKVKGKIEINNQGKKIKFTGVLIQSPEGGSGRGLGTFNTSRDTGTVTISASGGGSGTPTPTPTPDPNPLPVVQ